MYFKSLKILFLFFLLINELVTSAKEDMNARIRKELKSSENATTETVVTSDAQQIKNTEPETDLEASKMISTNQKESSEKLININKPTWNFAKIAGRNGESLKHTDSILKVGNEIVFNQAQREEKFEGKNYVINEKEELSQREQMTKEEIKEEKLAPKMETKNPTENREENPEGPEGGILVVSLGAGEDEILASHLAWLFVSHAHNVTVLLYGEGPREESFPKEAKILTINIDKDDPLRPDGNSVIGITPEDASSEEWAAGKVVWSRLGACRHLPEIETSLESIKPKVVVTPLFLHDVCVLSLAERLKIPVVGILTSRIGAWWTWAQLGVLPSLSTVPVPLTSLGDGSVWSRAANLASHYGYMSSLRQQWHVKAVNSLPATWNTLSLDKLYGNVKRLFLAWDPLVDPHAVPVPSAIPIGGFAATFEGEMVKDILVPALLNRAGIVVVLAGTREAWIGSTVLRYLYTALNSTSFTVLWKTHHANLIPINSSQPGEVSTAKFIFKNKIPLNDVLRHSRHRFMISTCGEHEVMAAVFFGSPILCLPVTTDQILASNELKRLGMAETLLASKVTKENLHQAIKRLSNERRFRLKARELAEDLHDQPTTPSERLIFHVENVMRRPNSVRYKIFGSRLPLLQQTNADVYLIVIFVLFSFTGIIMMASIKLYPVLKKSTKVKDD